MDKPEDMSNMQLEAEKLTLKQEHDAVKSDILKKLDLLDMIETRFKDVEVALLKRQGKI